MNNYEYNFYSEEKWQHYDNNVQMVFQSDGITLHSCSPNIWNYQCVLMFNSEDTKEGLKATSTTNTVLDNHLCSIISLNGGFLIKESPRELRPKLMLKCTFPRPVLRYM